MADVTAPVVYQSIADRLNPKRRAFDSDFKEKWAGLSKKARAKLMKSS